MPQCKNLQIKISSDFCSMHAVFNAKSVLLAVHAQKIGAIKVNPIPGRQLTVEMEASPALGALQHLVVSAANADNGPAGASEVDLLRR